MEQKMMKFKKKNMIQDVEIDAWDLHSFTWQQNTYLGISKLHSKTFALFKWVYNRLVPNFSPSHILSEVKFLPC